jgi:hypothetical protein
MDTQIIEAIWSQNYLHGTQPYLALIDRERADLFTERQWKFYPDLEKHIIEGPGQDLFFSPLLFKGERKNSNVAPPGVLYADLDNVWERLDQLHKLWPHVMWLTSDNNAQAVWFLDAPMADLNAWHDLNQRMTYFMGADKGGWHASKLLRVPGSLNWKYDPPQQGKVWSFQPKAAPYEAEALRDSLPPVKSGGFNRVEAVPTPIPQAEWKSHLAKIWPRLPLRTRADLLAPGMHDRSEALVRASNKMRFAGISPEDQFHALWWTEWNKFRTDRHRPDLLWGIVTYEVVS